MKKLFLLLSLLLGWTFPGVCADEYLDISLMSGISNDTSIENWTFPLGKTTLWFGNDGGSIPPKYYTTGPTLRMYNGNILSVSGNESNIQITSVKFTFYNNKDWTSSPQLNSGDYSTSTKTWTGYTHEVVIKSKETVYIKRIDVTYTYGSSEVPVTSIRLDKNSISLTEGDSYQLKATVSPSNATNKTVTWSSSNSSVTTVDNNGNVKAIKAGNATITAKSGSVSATCSVTVQAKGPTEIPVSSISLDSSSLDLTIGDTYRLKATVSPSNATNKTVTWTSSNGTVASVDNDGNVKALKVGNATITAKSGSVSATCNITVKSKTAVIDGITYLYEDGVSEVSVGPGSYGSLSYLDIPNTVVINSKTYNVTSIEKEAFKNSTSLKEVILPSSIKTVGTDAFSGCSGLLKSAYSETLPNPFPNGDAIRYPASCVMQDGIIYDSQKTKIYFVSIRTKGEFSIPSTVKAIIDNAFKNCNELNTISIGNSVTDIGASSFDKCTGLKKVKINNLGPWCLINFANETANPLYNGHNLIVEDAEIIDLILPQTVSTVKDYAFINCNQFKSITIPENIYSLGKKVFEGCNMVTSVTAYPQNPPTIAGDTFSNYDATLYVPDVSRFTYENANYWKNFTNIELINVVYLGIIGFNKELKSKPVEILDLTSVDTYTDWVTNLSLNSNTLLYHAVNTGIATLQSATYKNKLSNAVLVTFTDGLDQGSLALNYNFRTDQEFAQYLSEVISETKVQDVPLQAYAIGVKGTDVSDDALFMTNLNSLSSKPENVHQVSSMSQISDEFNAIYEDIVRQKDQLILTISVPFMSDGAICRFTFDNASNAEFSNAWVQGTFNRSTMSLENITYEGLSSNSGNRIQGIQNGLNVSFSFFDCRDRYGNILQFPDKDYIDQWIYVDSNKTWQHNVEMGNNDIELEKRNSTAVMMLIDCSSSIGSSDFKNIQNVANIFIERLINYKGKYNTEVEEIYVDNDTPRPINIYTLQGICIKRNATEEDINNLPRGMYIIGGNKVLKR